MMHAISSGSKTHETPAGNISAFGLSVKVLVMGYRSLVFVLVLELGISLEKGKMQVW